MKNVLKNQMVQLTAPSSIKSGDHDAFLAAYGEFHIKVFRFFLKRVVSNDIAKDLTQQCFIRLWQFRHTLSNDHSLEKQIFVIARSLLINYFEKEVYLKKMKASQLQVAKENASYDDHVAFELTNHVNAAIETLPPVRKKIIILKTFHHYTNKEIAEQMEISVKTVEDHITKAFRHLRQVMSIIIFIILNC
jgi:RNA polymerase sigma factor (sigma-70 family)